MVNICTNLYFRLFQGFQGIQNINILPRNVDGAIPCRQNGYMLHGLAFSTVRILQDNAET